MDSPSRRMCVGWHVRADVDGSLFDVEIRTRDGELKVLEKLRFPVPGLHNVLNCLGSIAVAHELGIDGRTIAKALKGFGGVKRRFTKTGEVGGITIIDDYGHHPVEIAATLKAARSFRGDDSQRIIAVVQPHRYTRLRDLFDQFCTCFDDSDMVVVADVYEAGEEPIVGYDRDALVEGLKAAGHQHVYALESQDALAGLVVEIAKPGDMVVCLGAGNITHWAHALPRELEGLLGKQKRVG